MSAHHRVGRAKLITFEGEARSGKGTSAKAAFQVLERAGQNVTFIDNGQKYRVLARLAVDRGIDLFDQMAISDFLRSSMVRAELLDLLEEITHLDQPEIEALLYTADISTGSAQFGANALTHPMVLDLLFDQVQRAEDNGAQIILLDGRTMAAKGRQMASQGIAEFVLGFYFHCDAAVAARRTEGIFADTDKMTSDEKLRLLDGIMRISERNRQDTLRGADPMREPNGTLPLHTDEFRPNDAAYLDALTRQALLAGVVSINTSYTRNVEEMTGPVTAITLHALGISK